jgi:hypothetical protein
MTLEQWNEIERAFNAKPLTIDEILNALSDYREYNNSKIKYSYEFGQKVWNELKEKYPTLPYALNYHHFIADYEPREVGNEWWVAYDPK